MPNGKTEKIDLCDLADQIEEIGFIVAFLGHASKELVNSEFAHPEPFKQGLQLCFEHLSNRIESLAQGVYQTQNA